MTTAHTHACRYCLEAVPCEKNCDVDDNDYSTRPMCEGCREMNEWAAA